MFGDLRFSNELPAWQTCGLHRLWFDCSSDGRIVPCAADALGGTLQEGEIRKHQQYTIVVVSNNFVFSSLFGEDS